MPPREPSEHWVQFAPNHNFGYFLHHGLHDDSIGCHELDRGCMFLANNGLKLLGCQLLRLMLVDLALHLNKLITCVDRWLQTN